MILRHTVTIQSRTGTTGSEGERTFSFATLKTIPADVQPVTLTPAQLQSWGMTDLQANAKKMFFAPDDSIQILHRVVFGGESFEIRNINPWRVHYEATLTPVQGV